MPRPKYKALYEGESARAAAWKDRAQSYRREIERLRSVMSPVGRQVLAALDPAQPGYVVNALDYECVRASFTDACRFVNADEEDLLRPELLTWKGKPIRRA